MTVTLMEPDNMQSMVEMSEDATVRNTSKYHVFWRTTKRNGMSVDPFTSRVMDGDTVPWERVVDALLPGAAATPNPDVNSGSSSEEPISKKSGRANLEGEYLPEFIDLLVKEGLK